MKKTLVVLVLVIALFLTGCNSEDSKNTGKSLANHTYEFVSVSSKGDTLTAAQMNGIGAAHPTVSFTDQEMNLYYVMQFPVIQYTYVNDGKYKLTITSEDGKKVEMGSITEEADQQIRIDFSIEDVKQTFVFRMAK